MIARVVLENNKILMDKLRISNIAYRRGQWQPTPVLLPGESHGWRSLVGCSPWGHWESNMTERLHFDFSLSCVGEGNGNPLQCSWLENPRDRGAWWAAVSGVAQSRTRLKWLSSSNSSNIAYQVVGSIYHNQLLFRLSRKQKMNTNFHLPLHQKIT